MADMDVVAGPRVSYLCPLWDLSTQLSWLPLLWSPVAPTSQTGFCGGTGPVPMSQPEGPLLAGAGLAMGVSARGTLGHLRGLMAHVSGQQGSADSSLVLSRAWVTPTHSPSPRELTDPPTPSLQLQRRAAVLGGGHGL